MQADIDKHNIFIGRQAIYDRKLHVFAYELLYRHCADNKAVIVNGDHATSQIITSLFIELGLENIVGSKPAFINITGDFFLGDYPLAMSPEQVVLELLENIEPSNEIIAGARRLTEHGFRIALDDYLLKQKTRPLLELASYVKLDILQMSEQELNHTVTELRHHPSIRLIAEKVETPEQYKYCRELGFDYFQGYFFARPDVIKTHTTIINHAVVFNLLAQLRNPDITMPELEHLIAHDAVLSYRLLRYINSASFALRREIDSIQQALMLLGLDAVRKWSTLLLLAQASAHKPPELMTLALIRARMCELLAITHEGIDFNQAFTVGLFSLLDAMLDQDMASLLDQLPLSMSVKLALLNHDGPLGNLLHMVINYERGQWDGLVLHEDMSISYQSAYLAAVSWADSSTQLLYAKPGATH